MDILIVDDDTSHSASVRDVLGAHQYPNADIAETGTQGLAMLRNPAQRYQVLILDLHIPDLSGIEILRTIRAEGIAVKTIVLSGERELDSVTPILKLGAFDYIRKPYDPPELVTSVANAIAKHQLEQEVERMQKTVQENAELYEFLLNASPDMVYLLDADGTFKFVNHQLDGVFDTDPQALRQQPWTELFRGHSELVDALERQFNERRTGIRATLGHEFDYRSAVGTRHSLELSSIGLYEPDADDNPQFIGTYGVVRDVTESRRTRRQLIQNQRKFQTLFANSPDAVFIARLDTGEILERNSHFIEICAAMGAQDDGTDAFLWTAEHTREHFLEGLTHNPQFFDSTFSKTVDGVERFFELRARALELEGEHCLVATVRDRTAERRAEMDRLALEQQLQQAGRMEAIGQVAGGIAHDFNNILASIIGYAELIMTAHARLDQTQINEYLNEVVTAGHRARDLISQMLTFTRAQKGDASAVDIETTIADVSRMLDAAIPSMIEVRTRFEEALPKVWIDPIQIQQIIINLLINARDAIEGTGTISVNVARSKAAVTCQTCGAVYDEPHVVIEVADTGHGIPSELLDSVFEMYFTTRAPDQGTGFGLWMINSLVHQHDGHLSLTTAVGAGTTFRIHLPEVSVVDQLAAPSTVPTPRIRGRIVVVDDEVSVANFVGEVLRDKGYPTVVFSESPQALEYLTNNMDKTALLLTDGRMPLISGIELVERCRAMRADLPVIFITAYAQNLDMQAIENLNVNTFLKKPFSIDEMLAAVGSLVEATTSVDTES